jgi:sugar phosphate isomerase/epimerase
MTNRRDFLRNASLLTLGGLVAGRTASATSTASAPVIAPAAKKNIGLQTYSLGRALWEDVPGGLKKLASYGYTHLEMAGYNGDGKFGTVAMGDFKKMATDANLKIISSHLNPPIREAYSDSNLQQIKDFWKKAADQHAAIGCTYIVQPGMPRVVSVEAGQYVGKVFTEAGKIAKAVGLQWGYHNHNMEFAKVVPGGTEAMPLGSRGRRGETDNSKFIEDLFIQNSDPAYVTFELDVYWTVMGMQDPVAYMKANANRIKLLHIKDKEVLGESGMMNFEMIFKTAYEIGVKDWYVELENIQSRPDQFVGVKDCAAYLLKSPFVK